MPVPDSSSFTSSVKGRANAGGSLASSLNGPKPNSIAAVRQYSVTRKGVASKRLPNYVITQADLSNGSNLRAFGIG